MSTATTTPYVIADPAGIEDDATLCLSFQPGDDEDEHRNVTSILINGQIDVGIEQARIVGQRLLALADSVTPAAREGLDALLLPLRVINEHRGTTHTLESLAAACGVDLDNASEADKFAMCAHIGGNLMAAAS